MFYDEVEGVEGGGGGIREEGASASSGESHVGVLNSPPAVSSFKFPCFISSPTGLPPASSFWRFSSSTIVFSSSKTLFYSANKLVLGIAYYFIFLFQSILQLKLRMSAHLLFHELNFLP